MLFLLSVTGGLLGLFSQSSAAFTSFIAQYGYAAVFALMVIEGATGPVPSEIVLPVVGLLIFKGQMNPYISLAVIYVASLVGMAIDYYIAYFLEKELVYKHLHWFHIKKETIENFDRWFAANGSFAVFISRMIPVVRTVINFPAGFAKMDKKKFFGYSMAGAIIWDTLLVMFGYYALSVNNLTLVLALVGAFGIALYVVYKLGMKHMRKMPADKHE